MPSPHDTPVTQVPIGGPKQRTTPPTSTPNAKAPFGRLKHESGLKPKGNGTPPKGGKYR